MSKEQVWPRMITAAALGPGSDWAIRFERFYDWQCSRWPALDEARIKLADIRVREIEVDGGMVVVQWNPARATSATAKVDDESIRRRACFLCPENQPDEEWGLAFDRELVILTNPAPIVSRHFVLAHRHHRAQLLHPVIADLSAVPARSGGTMTTLYNGARCGASAPDHLHLQAIASGWSPFERRLRKTWPRGAETSCVEIGTGAQLTVVVERWARRTAICVRGSRPRVDSAVEKIIAAWTEHTGEPAEGPLNAMGFAIGEESIVVIFPRGAHRPSCYHQGRVLVSPGALDMAGLFVTIREQDFDSFDAELVREIFAETSISEAQTEELIMVLRARFQDG